MNTDWIYRTNQYGVREYKNMPILLGSLFVFVIIVSLAAAAVFVAEQGAPGSNVTTYRDAFWLVYMAASTIGFGDFYPVTDMGRVIIGSMFIVGSAMAGIIIGIAIDMATGFTDTEVKNQELRKQNADILQELKDAKEAYQKADLENAETIKRNLSLIMENMGLTEE